MNQRVDLIGERYGKLLVVSAAGSRYGQCLWACKCDCGNTTFVVAGNLRKKKGTVSCGCAISEALIGRSSTHGHTGANSKHTKAFRVWGCMIRRCTDKANKDWGRYGGRGITVCETWLNSFDAFLLDMGDPPESKSLDRINNDLGYSKSNCRWADRVVQGNNRGTNRLITYNGETNTMTCWARKLGINQSTLHRRIVHLGWPIEKAFINKRFHKSS